MESNANRESHHGNSVLAALETYLEILVREWAGTPEPERYEAVRLALDASRRARRLLLGGPEEREGTDAT